MKKTPKRSLAVLRTLLLTSLIACQPNTHATGSIPHGICPNRWSYDGGEMVLVSSDAGATKASADAEVDLLYNDRCATCHGSNGDGKGPTAEYMSPPPMNFHDPKWQRSVSDAKIAKAIVYGGASVGLSESMPGNPDLETQPKMVAALVHRIRKLAR